MYVCVRVRVLFMFLLVLLFSPPYRRQWGSTSQHSIGPAGVNLGEVSVLIRRRKVVQRVKRILGLKIVNEGARDGGG